MCWRDHASTLLAVCNVSRAGWMKMGNNLAVLSEIDWQASDDFILRAKSVTYVIITTH